MAFSPLLAENQGFGYGWSPALTRWDETSKLLVLSTGERYYGHWPDKDDSLMAFPDNEDGPLMVFPDMKLPALALRKEKDGDDWLLLYPDGRSERLQREGQYHVPRTLFSPEGRAVHFTWQTFNSVPALTSVYESLPGQAERVLLRVQYFSTGTTLTLQPETAQAVCLRLDQASDNVPDEVRHLILETPAADSNWQEEAKWTFRYCLSPEGLLLVEKVDLPTGGTETVIYHDREGQKQALLLPGGAPLRVMPAVV
ncbi:hypothetical protein ACQRKX_004906, partial [Enterobacter cloacae]